MLIKIKIIKRYIAGRKLYKTSGKEGKNKRRTRITEADNGTEVEC